MKTESQVYAEIVWKSLETFNKEEIGFTTLFEPQLSIYGFDYAYKLKHKFFPYPIQDEMSPSEYSLVVLFTILLMIDGE